MATIADTVGCNVATDLSLSDAARVLSKTPRQVRTMIKQGELASHKSPNGRWVVDSEALPLSQGQLDARARKVGALRGETQ